MSVRAEVRRELERAMTAIDKVNAHLEKAGAYSIEGKRPEVDKALMGLATMLEMARQNLAALRGSI